ncbi:MAG: GNAT family N-acetyltransferase [Candidatus Peribacteria bacterium]|jgi:ribosomal protein S18 acetylase RimI-like enzyme|nr:GNAT family N-acetyltransferase [Candidatus Peribacteria bacterium]
MNLKIIKTKDLQYFLPLFEGVVEFKDMAFKSDILDYLQGNENPLFKMQEVYVIFDENEVAGISGIYQYTDTPEGLYWVNWLGVLPRFRRQGIGNFIIEDIYMRCKKRNADRIKVYTDDFNTVAIHLYEKHGFHIIPERSDTHVDLEKYPSCTVLEHVF